MSRWWPKDSAIMFDVGASGVRACQARRAGGAASISDALLIEHPEFDQSVPVVDCSRLARLAGQGVFRGRDVGIVLSPPEVHLHALTLPPAVLAGDPERAEQALAFELTRETRIEPADQEIRFWPLPPKHREGVNVMAVATSRKQIQQWGEALQREGLNLRRIDVAPLALAHAAAHRQEDPSQVWGVLDIGVRRSALTMLIGRTPVYMRTIGVSSLAWTRQIAECFDVSPQEAEELKREFGLRSTGPVGARRAADLTSKDDVGGVIFGLLYDSAQSMLRSINLCFSYVLENYQDHSVGRLVLAGGGSRMSGLADLLSEFLDIPVEMITPASGDAPAGAASQDVRGAAAAGAALRDLEDAA